MVSRNIAAEFGQLARQRFGKAARLLYASVGLEAGSVLVSFTLLLFSVNGDAGIVGGAIVVGALIVAYCLRLAFQQIYDSGETMRRQAVLTEALGWPIGAMSASEWMRRAGWKEASRAMDQPLPDDYYASREDHGGKRLAEMTAESAFYTRHLYGKVQPWLQCILVAAVVLVIAGFVTVPLRATSSQTDTIIFQAIYLLVPLLVSWDLFGWWRRVGSLTSDIAAIERELESLHIHDVPTVLRIVMEYNCLLVTGFPVLDWLFLRWQPEIQQFWRAHAERQR